MTSDPFILISFCEFHIISWIQLFSHPYIIPYDTTSTPTRMIKFVFTINQNFYFTHTKAKTARSRTCTSMGATGLGFKNCMNVKVIYHLYSLFHVTQSLSIVRHIKKQEIKTWYMYNRHPVNSVEQDSFYLWIYCPIMILVWYIHRTTIN